MKRAVLVIFAASFAATLAPAQADNPALDFEQRLVKARPLPLEDVRLTGGPLKHAQELELEYLLALEPDRMLAYLRRSARLDPRAQGYGGWDGDGRQLTGHIAGHYLSAVSLAWAATGDARFKDRADYIVNELKLIQQAQADGYVGALMDNSRTDGKVLFQELSKGIIRSGGFDLNGMWSPWYVEHKIFAGLRDAWRHTSNRTALDVEIRFAAWVESILAPLNGEQIQRMLATEFGGMNEVLADLYADTADPRWLALAGKFHHAAMIDRLAQKQDILPGIHGNTQVPKLYGALKVYMYTGNEMEGAAARYFWDEVAQHHTFATGGNTRNEYFGQPDHLSSMIDGRTAETCNIYNMIKMARTLFSLDPSVRYADYHERALFNHILASQDPDDGRVCYMVPVGRGVQHEYNAKFQSFTCCVGSAMESHALHADGLYYESGYKLWVNLYAPSTAEWKSAGMKLEVSTDLPLGQTASVKLTPKSSKKFTLALRRPFWAGDGFAVRVNGAAFKTAAPPDAYVEIARTWKAGDTVEIVLPKTLRKEVLADNPNRFAVMWGPLVLAGDMGPELSRGAHPADAPVFVAPDEPVTNWLRPVGGKPGAFRTTGVGLKEEIDFVPFYQLPRRRYAIYWDMYTPAEWTRRETEYRAKEEKQKKLEAATIGFAQPGQMQAERDANQQGDGSAPVRVDDRFGRAATNWFSFDLAVDPAHPMTLIVTYSNDNRGPSACNVLVEGSQVGEQTGARRSPEQETRFFDVEYPIPPGSVAGKTKVTVRFEANNARSTPTVFGIRIVRSDMER
ncbi:MAG TPA: beta-L-arabinofuranosidase domain-containing protein [Bryobacteraceae bacterium]|nr:beta-L-arabinofuranosidase domain-containing protein [Bryobacteraceae bacterium]